MSNNILVKLKKIFRLIKNYIISEYIIKFLFKSKINNKKYVFDLTEKNKELLATNQNKEKYIVNTSDIVIGRTLYINGDFEFINFLNALEIIENKIKRKTLIDIGANIGSICIPAINRGYFDKCIAIEPDPYNYSLLKKNIYINDLSKKIEVFNVALGQLDNELLSLEFSENNFGDHRIRLNSKDKNYNNHYKEDKRKIITVNSRKLDTIIKNFNPNETFIWIDVQGWEAFVLNGGHNIIKQKPPLYIEFWPYGLDRNFSYDLLKKILIEVNYKNFYDTETKLKLNITEKNLDKIYFKLKSNGPTAFTNLLFYD